MVLMSIRVVCALIFVGLLFAKVDSQNESSSNAAPRISNSSSIPESQLPTSSPPKLTKSKQRLKKTFPDENDSWEKMRKKNAYLVDKTEYLRKLLDRGTTLYSFTRGRIIGKSVFLKMIKSFFRGKSADLFYGTAIGK